MGGCEVDAEPERDAEPDSGGGGPSIPLIARIPTAAASPAPSRKARGRGRKSQDVPTEPSYVSVSMPAISFSRCARMASRPLICCALSSIRMPSGSKSAAVLTASSAVNADA